MACRFLLPLAALAFTSLVWASCGGAESPSTEPAKARSGVTLYREACALCHGIRGDGKGTVVLDRPARSFLEGAFSFGNTAEALFRTVSTGIGGTPMPGFANQLTAKERRAVVAYVMELGPKTVRANPASTILEVSTRPQVVRGSFPPLQQGLSMIPRGLLLGGMDGLSFQYDASDIRLLAVRQGDFVDRKDWNNRGGDPLEPLGSIIYLYDSGHPQSMWILADKNAKVKPLVAHLRATEIRGEKVLLEYALFLESQQLAVVVETSSALSREGWSGFRRKFQIEIQQGVLADFRLRNPECESSRILFSHAGEQTLLLQDSIHGSSILHRKRQLDAQDDRRFSLSFDLLFGMTPTPEHLAAFEGAF